MSQGNWLEAKENGALSPELSRTLPPFKVILASQAKDRDKAVLQNIP